MRLGATRFGALTGVCEGQINIVHKRHIIASIVGYLLLGLARLASAGESGTPSEYQLKAAFMFNFTKFVEWPAGSFTDTEMPFKIGVIGDDPFGGELEAIVQGKKMGSRAFLVKQLKTLAEIKTCHILFISQSERKRLSDIIRAANAGSVLTVSELDRFMQSGGMIRFVMEGNKVRFEINDDAARKAGLRISSKLLNLARRERSDTK
jgi:hypothetical protein